VKARFFYLSEEVEYFALVVVWLVVEDLDQSQERCGGRMRPKKLNSSRLR